MYIRIFHSELALEYVAEPVCLTSGVCRSPTTQLKSAVLGPSQV